MSSRPGNAENCEKSLGVGRSWLGGAECGWVRVVKSFINYGQKLGQNRLEWRNFSKMFDFLWKEKM